MLAGFALVLAGIAPAACGAALLACAAMNGAWIYLTGEDGFVREGLAAGYYLWLASFAVVGVGALATSKRG
jgi:hypothetical protein